MKTKKLRIVIFSLAAIVLVKVSLNLLNSSITTQSESSIFQSITSLMDTLRTKSYCDDPNDVLYQGFHAGMNEANFNKELQANPNINQGKITMYFGVNDQISLEIKPTFNTRNCLNYLELQYNGGFDALGAIISNTSVTKFNTKEVLIVNEIRHDLKTKYGSESAVSGSGKYIYTYKKGKVKFVVEDQEILPTKTSTKKYIGKTVRVFYYSDVYLRFKQDSITTAVNDSLRQVRLLDSLRHAGDNPF